MGRANKPRRQEATLPSGRRVRVRGTGKRVAVVQLGRRGQYARVPLASLRWADR